MLNYPQLPSLGGNILGEMFTTTTSAGDLLRSISGPTDADKPIVIELAVAAMEELIRLAQTDEPLWMNQNSDNNDLILNEEEYARTFPRGIGPKSLGLKSEASRESAVVIIDYLHLVEILMDVVLVLLFFSFLKLY